MSDRNEAVSDTPKSDAALKLWPIFAEALLARMENGKREYGDRSFERDPISLLEEAQEELLDALAWPFIGWVRLEEIKVRLREALLESARALIA